MHVYNARDSEARGVEGLPSRDWMGFPASVPIWDVTRTTILDDVQLKASSRMPMYNVELSVTTLPMG